MTTCFVFLTISQTKLTSMTVDCLPLKTEKSNNKLGVSSKNNGVTENLLKTRRKINYYFYKTNL